MLSVLLAASCSLEQGSAKGPKTTCTGAKCDDTSQIDSAEQVLMQKAPPGETAITRNTAGQWFFHTVGKRGEIVLFSQPYVQRASAANGILSVEENAVDPDRYVIQQLTDGRWQFSLRAKNNVEIATSRAFDTEAEAVAGIEEARALVASIVQFKADVEKGARFDLTRSAEDGEWYFTLLDKDGTKLLNSEGYTGRTGAVNGIQSVRLNGKDESKYKQLDGLIFILKAGNGHEIARSETYADEAALLAGMQRVQQLLKSERVANPW